MKTFKVAEDHIKLAQRVYTSWDPSEFGAPEINPKRPYGNSDVVTDIREIVGQRDEDELVLLHHEMQVVLAIALRTCQLTPGEYVADDYDENWAKVDAGV